MIKKPRPVAILETFEARAKHMQFQGRPVRSFWESIERAAGLPAHMVPMATWNAAWRPTDGGDEDDARMAADIAYHLAQWRLSKGIYRFDPTLLDELASGGVPENTPCEIFARLPEPSIWVETAGRCHLDGFFARLWSDDGEGGAPSRMALLCDIGLGMPFPHTVLFGESVGENIRGIIDFLEANGGVYLQMDALLRFVFTLLAYLCSDEPDYDDGRVPPPLKPPARLKGGRRMWLPRPAPTEWGVGARIGAAIRSFAPPTESRGHTGDGTPTGRTVRPHIRRAHWHGFWTGARKEPEKRRFVHRWIPPIPINVRPDDELPAVIRAVKKNKGEAK